MRTSRTPRSRHSRLSRYSLTKFGLVPTTEQIFIEDPHGRASCHVPSPSLAFDLSPVGGLDRVKHIRLYDPLQDFNIRHHTVTPDDSGKVLDGWKELYLFVERHNLVVVLSKLIAVPLQLLRPRDHEAEVRRLGQLRQFRRFRGGQNARA